MPDWFATRRVRQVLAGQSVCAKSLALIACQCLMDRLSGQKSRCCERSWRFASALLGCRSLSRCFRPARAGQASEMGVQNVPKTLLAAFATDCHSRAYVTGGEAKPATTHLLKIDEATTSFRPKMGVPNVPKTPRSRLRWEARKLVHKNQASSYVVANQSG